VFLIISSYTNDFHDDIFYNSAFLYFNDKNTVFCDFISKIFIRNSDLYHPSPIKIFDYIYLLN